MYAGVVELNALAYAYGPGAQHHNGLFVPFITDKLRGLVLPAAFRGVIGSVKVGGMGGELSRAGVHHLEGGLALIVHLAAREPCYGRVRVSQPLAPGVEFLGKLAFHKLPLVVQQVHKLREEPPVYHGQFIELVHGLPAL